MNASFTAKQLRATITLASTGATFPGTNSNVLTLAWPLRMISMTTGVARSTVNLDLKIFGMSQPDMNALSVIWFNQPTIQINTVVLEANSGNGWTQVFSGTIYDASPDYTAQPNVFFRILANQSYAAQITPVAPSSYTGAASVAAIVANLAKQMGFAFENNGVTATLHNPYLPGTAYDQLQRVCEASDTDFYFAGKTLAITPSGMGRTNPPTTILNAQSGLVSYPVIEQFGLTVQAFFNPSIQGGGQIQITGSEVPAANGPWNPFHFVHALDSNNPNGPWMTTMKCVKWGTTQPDISQ